MMHSKDIPWFNPRQMSADTVLKLSTGRETLLHDFFLLARQRLREPSAGRHWLVTGPRGAGKSFFLCLVNAMWPKVMAETATLVLLPEELPNVYAPHEWLREVQRLLPGQPHSQGTSPSWQTPEKDEASAWDEALRSLLAAFPGTLLVIGVENFDMLLQQAFDSPVRASRLRSLMENEPRIMLLASAVEGEFDEAYEKRLFRQFEHHAVPRWNETDHRDYLSRRARLLGKEPTQRQLARIDAYSRFTGGSARVAAVLASAILDEQDPVSASADLTATLDRMSDYYRSLIEKIPANTRKVFDALIRGGEPASQVALAARVHARQNDISRAFRWLVDYGYVVNERRPGTKEHSYRVTDRLFVQFYRMRYIDPGQPCQLAILADLLATTIEFRHKWHFAEGYLGSEKPAEAEFMAKLACSERGVDVSLLPESSRDAASLVAMGKEWLWMDSVSESETLAAFYSKSFERFKTDQELRGACARARNLAFALLKASGAEEVIAIMEKMPLSTALRYRYYAHIVKDGDRDRLSKLISRFHKAADGLREVYSRKDTFSGVVQLDSEHPLANSILDAVDSIGKHKEMAGVTNEQAAEWAVRAVGLWANTGILQPASNSVMRSEQFIFALLNEADGPNSAVRILKPIEPILGFLEKSEAYKLCRLQGIALREADQFENAAAAFHRTLSYTDQKPLSAADSHEQIAWCFAMLGKVDESIEQNQLALLAWKDSPFTERRAYNLGQIGRHMCRQSSFDAAWDYVISNKKIAQDSWEVTLLQFAEAVWDAWRVNGEAAAFQLAKRLFLSLGKNPEIQGLNVQVGIWIKMVDAGIPIELLRELLAEAAGIWGESVFQQIFFDRLGSWLDYLEGSPDKRSQVLAQLAPDTSELTLSICECLSLKTRIRLGLTKRTKIRTA